MNMTDPLADMFTRIRNAAKAKHDAVDIPFSKMKEAIADILKQEGYILGYKEISGKGPKKLRVYLKYLEDKSCVIEGIKRVSKPSLRVYVKHQQIRPVRRRMGIAILSTSQGVMTNREAKLKGIGGELLCEVW
jgi:small subunit ribosomal protein S8